MSHQNLHHIICFKLLGLFVSSNEWGYKNLSYQTDITNIRTSDMEKWVYAWDQVMQANMGFIIIILIIY